jgi:hypothetical protein
VIDESPADPRIRADHEFLGTNLRISVHRAVDVHGGPGCLQVLVRVALERHARAGERDRPSHDRRRSQRDVAARGARIPVHDGVQLHVAAGCIEIVAHVAADREFAADNDQVAPHFARDRDLPTQEERVAFDRLGQVEHPARAEVVGAELAGNGIVTVVVDAATAAGRQAERDERHG